MKLSLIFFMVFLSLPGFSQEEDEAFVEEISQERLKKVEEANKLDQARQDFQKKTFNMAHELQKIGRDQLDYAALFDDKVQAILKEAIKESELRKKSPEFIRAMIRGKAKGSAFEGLFERFPALLEICVDVMKDDEALPGLIGIFAKKDELKYYGIFWLFLLIAGHFIKKKLVPQELPFFRRLMGRLVLDLTLTAISLSVFYTMFKPEIGPTVQIIFKHF